MVENQIYELLNDTAAQVYGSDAVETLDLEGMLSLRDTVLGSGTDKFLNVLVDRIGKTVIRTLDFTATFPKLIMNDFEFGAVLQKISVQPFAAKSQNAWKVGENGFTPNQFTIDKADVRQSFFKNANAWEIDVTIPDQMFKTAFTSAEAMDAFITAIFDSIQTSLNIQLENESRLAILGMMAEKFKANNGIVNLLTLYNANNTPITADKALQNVDFLKYAGRVMRNYVKYLAKPSTLYNIEGWIRATSRDNMHVMMLTEFASAYTTMAADVFHEEMVALPYYSEVEYWQGTGNVAPNFEDCSTIDVKAPSDGTAVKHTGVVAVFADRQAIGTGLYDRFSAADRNNRNRYTNYTEGVTIQSFIDAATENALIFTIEDSE